MTFPGAPSLIPMDFGWKTRLKRFRLYNPKRHKVVITYIDNDLCIVIDPYLNFYHQPGNFN